MRDQQKLIMLNGFAGCGKTTIAKKYIDEHPLALRVECDEIISNIGQWQQYSEEAVKCKLALTESMVKTHLQSGYDVILPFLLLDDVHAIIYEKIALDIGADFFEVMLLVGKDEAIRRLIKRGTWGEAGLPPLTEKDIPKIKKLYDDMMTATNKRSKTINISPIEDKIEETYKTLLNIIE